MVNAIAFSEQEETILDMLCKGKKLYGLQMVEESKEKLKLGSIYVHLYKLENKQILFAEEDALRPNEYGKPRKLYSLTNYGKQLYECWVKYRQDTAEILALEEAKNADQAVLEFRDTGRTTKRCFRCGSNFKFFDGGSAFRIFCEVEGCFEEIVKGV